MNDLSSGFFAALSEALWASLWQGAIIGLTAAACLHAMRRSTPHARYLVACFALASCVVLPMLTFMSVLIAGHDTPAEAISMQGVIMPADGLTSGLAQSDLRDWAPYLVWSWFAGCSLLLARSTVAMVWLERAIRESQPASQRLWQLRIDLLADRMGVAQPVRLLLSGDLSSPVVAKVAHPVVLLPIAVTTRMSVEWVEALLAHELAHIRRHDYLVNLVQKVIEAVLFHQPAVWWLSSRIRHERELIADSIAVETGTHRRTLAAALAELVELRDFDAIPPDIALSARGGRLMSRIRTLVRPAAPVAIGHAMIPAIALLAVAVTLSIGTSSGVPSRHVATRVEREVDLRPAAVALPSVPAAQVRTVVGSGKALANAQVAEVVTTQEATRPMQAHPSGAVKLQAQLASLEALDRKMDELSTPMRALGTHMAELDTLRTQVADSIHIPGDAP